MIRTGVGGYEQSVLGNAAGLRLTLLAFSLLLLPTDVCVLGTFGLYSQAVCC